MPSNTITMKATGQFKWGAVQPWQRLLSQLPRGNQLPWHVARGQVVSPIELVGRQHQVGRHHQGLGQGGRHHQVGQHHQGGGDQLAGQRWPEAKLWTTSSFQTCEISSPTEREDSRLSVSWCLPAVHYTNFLKLNKMLKARLKQNTAMTNKPCTMCNGLQMSQPEPFPRLLAVALHILVL